MVKPLTLGALDKRQSRHPFKVKNAGSNPVCSTNVWYSRQRIRNGIEGYAAQKCHAWCDEPQTKNGQEAKRFLPVSLRNRRQLT